MKKKLVASLAAAMVLGVTGISFAAASPSANVPAKDSAYGSIATLTKAGIIDGNSTYNAKKVISRYEMAKMVAKAIARSDKANAAQKTIIDKLAKQFAKELKELKAKEKVQDKVGTVRFGGEIDVRYDNAKQDNTPSATLSHADADVWATAQLHPKWIGKVEYESKRKLINLGTTTTNGVEKNITRVFVKGALFDTEATIGKFNPATAYGLVIDNSITGAQFEFEDLLQTRIQARVGFGKYDGTINNITLGKSPTYVFEELTYAFDDKTNAKFAYHDIRIPRNDVASLNTRDNQTTIAYMEGGFDTKLTENLTLMATYAKSTLNIVNQDSDGYFTQLTYKAANTKKVHSYDLYTNFRKIPLSAQLDSTWDYAKNMRGWQVGFNYVPALNIKVNVSCFSGNSIVDKSIDINNKIYRVQVGYFF